MFDLVGMLFTVRVRSHVEDRGFMAANPVTFRLNNPQLV